MKKKYEPLSIFLGLFSLITLWTFFLMINYAWLKLVIKLINFIF